MGNLLPVIIQLVCGAIGGNVAGSLMPKQSLGGVGNSIAGIIGGGLGGQLLGQLGLGAGTSGTDIGSIIGSIAGGGVGGGILMIIVGIIKIALSKKK